jgi:UDP-glucose 4-epimerase
VVRYFNSYGPRIDESGYGSVIARFAGQALRGEPLTVHGDGGQTRCFTFVGDTVRGTILAATRDAAAGTVLNIGSQHEVSIRALAELVCTGLGARSPIEMVPYESYYPKGFEDTRRRVPDVTRAREILGFEATVSFADGLRETLEWCRRNYAGRQVMS